MTRPLPRTVDRQLRLRAQTVLPGGMYGHMSTVLLPENYPQFFSRARGAHVWDADGNRYLDLMCAFGPNLLGYAHESVDRVVADQLARGDIALGLGARSWSGSRGAVRRHGAPRRLGDVLQKRD